MNRRALIVLDKAVFSPASALIGLSRRLRAGASLSHPVRLREDPHILVIRPGGLGDAIMAGPLLRELRAGYPKARLVVLCVSKNRAALEAIGRHDDMVVLDEPARLGRNLARLRRERFDIVFDLEPFRKASGLVSLLTGAVVRVGFDTGTRRNLYTHLVSYAHDSRFEADNMLAQLAVVGIRPAADAGANLTFELARDAERTGEEVLARHGLDSPQRLLIAVAPGVLKPQHRWVMARFAELIRRVRQDERGATVVLLGAPDDVHDARAVLAELGDGYEGVVDLVGRTSYLESLAVLRRCRLLVASDGGIVYMAAAMGCATVSLWGPGVMERFKPPGPGHVGVRMDYPCIPCVTWDRLGEFPPCPYGRRCYNDLPASDVFDAYVQLRNRLARGQ